MRKLLLAAFLAVLSSSVISDCRSIINDLHPEWRVSYVQVPFDWSKPGQDLIDVAFYHKDQSHYTGKTPIMFFNGGPTVSGSVAVKLFQNMSSLKDENIVILDQRGNGCSGPFREYSGSNLDLFKNYASDSIVKDAEEIRKSFFKGSKWKVFGQSFGGLISFRYLELFPEAITSAHIHGFGFSSEQYMLDLREQRIKEITPEVLKYRNAKVSKLTIGELLNQVRQLDQVKGGIFGSVCVSTQQAGREKLCGEDFFMGTYMVTGFRDRWYVVQKFLASVVKLLEKEEVSALQETYTKFVTTYILRFNDLNQAAALNAVIYYELFPGRLFYDGCVNAAENELVSECRFSRNYILRMSERPTFLARPHDLNVIRKNIQRHQIPVKYYAGLYDTFLPVQTLVETAKRLELENSFVVFPDSGHEGFYSEKSVIENLKKF